MCNIFEQKHVYTSYSQKQNRWLEGGLKCSYIIPKPNSLNSTKEIEKHHSVCKS